jgi:gamma-glutamyltranspeptidase
MLLRNGWRAGKRISTTRQIAVNNIGVRELSFNCTGHNIFGIHGVNSRDPGFPGGAMRSFVRLSRIGALLLLGSIMVSPEGLLGQRTMKPVLHGRHWMAITGKPLGATAGAMMFQKGGNAVDAACAMLGATATMWDVLSWGGETQALIFNPVTGSVIGINALGVAPSGATVDFFQEQEMPYPPEYGPLAAVTPGTPGGLMVMLAEYGTLSLADVLEPSLQMAEGYPIEQDAVSRIERSKDRIKQWRYSRELFLPHIGQEHEAPKPGEIFQQPDLAVTLSKLVEAEQQALAQGKNRKDAIYAAYDRFYRGDIAAEFVRGSQEEQADDMGARPSLVTGAEHVGGYRSQGHGLQQHAVHPHLVPGYEPGLCRSGLLLRRSVLSP